MFYFICFNVLLLLSKSKSVKTGHMPYPALAIAAIGQGQGAPSRCKSNEQREDPNSPDALFTSMASKPAAVVPVGSTARSALSISP